MATIEQRAAVQAAIKEQGEVVRKLKAEKADKDKVWVLLLIFTSATLCKRLCRKSAVNCHICRQNDSGI